MTDPRLDPTRGGQIAGLPRRLLAVISGAPMRKTPDDTAEQISQLRYGDAFDAYELVGSYVWGQRVKDAYVGYVPREALQDFPFTPTHRIRINTSFVFAAPSIKAQVRDVFTYFTPVEIVQGGDERFAKVSTGGFLHRQHLTAIADWNTPDIGTTAARFVDVPYLWGGITALGLDCSGLIQLACEAAGLPCPRDSDMQAAQLGEKIADHVNGPLQRGDLIFMPGHVGIMADAQNLLHANAFHGRTVIEPLADVVTRSPDAAFSVRRLH